MMQTLRRLSRGGTYFLHEIVDDDEHAPIGIAPALFSSWARADALDPSRLAPAHPRLGGGHPDHDPGFFNGGPHVCGPVEPGPRVLGEEGGLEGAAPALRVRPV